MSERGHTAAEEVFLAKPADFSLVLGGPLYQLWRGTRLAGDALELLHRRIIAMALVTWVPLLLLSIAEGHAWGDSVTLPFLHDVELHVRLLLALPLLIVAELVVHQRMRPVVGQFLDRGLIPDAARAQFDAAIASALRLRNSVAAEVLLIAFVYVVGVGFIWRTQSPWTWRVGTACRRMADGSRRWPGGGWASSACRCSSSCCCAGISGCSSGRASCGRCRASICGSCRRIRTARAAWASSARWPMRSRRCCWPRGSLLAGMIANRIFYAGATLPEFKLELIGLVALMVFAILGPMLVFGPQLAAAKRAGLREYGMLAQRYVREFDGKWLRGGAPADEPLIGSADIQSLADLGNSFEVVKGMRFGAVHLADGAATGGDHAAAGGAADADDDFAGGVARAVAQGRLLTDRAADELNGKLTRRSQDPRTGGAQ